MNYSDVISKQVCIFCGAPIDINHFCQYCGCYYNKDISKIKGFNSEDITFMVSDVDVIKESNFFENKISIIYNNEEQWSFIENWIKNLLNFFTDFSQNGKQNIRIICKKDNNPINILLCGAIPTVNKKHYGETNNFETILLYDSFFVESYNE